MCLGNLDLTSVTQKAFNQKESGYSHVRKPYICSGYQIETDTKWHQLHRHQSRPTAKIDACSKVACVGNTVGAKKGDI